MKTAKKHKRERGIALLLTLGMLSLILIMAMSFSFQASTDRMLAGNNSSLVRARLLCESGMSRVMAAMQMKYANDPYPAKAASTSFVQVGTSGQYYWLGSKPTSQSVQDTVGLETALATDLFPSNVTSVLISGTPTPSWQHVLNSTGDLIGRIGFYVMDEGGKIDPGAVVTPNHEPFFDMNDDGKADPSDDFFDGDYYVNLNSSVSPYSAASHVYDSAEVLETNPTNRSITGQSPQEIKVDDGFRGRLAAAHVDLDLDTFPDDFADSWFSLWHIARGYYDPVSDPPVLQWSDYRKYFPFSYDIEAYYSGTPPTDKHRFDLSGFSWDPTSNDMSAWDDTDWVSVTVNGTTGAFTSTGTIDITTVGATAADFWNDPATRTSVHAPSDLAAGEGGLAWLSTLEAGDGTSLTRQVCANLIDYCDSDSIPTIYYDSGTQVLVCGLEAVPYINELPVQIAFSKSATGGESFTGAGNWLGRKIEIKMAAEVINMFATAQTVSLLVSASFNIEVDMDGAGSGGNTTYTMSGTWIAASLNAPANSYKKTDPPSTVATQTFNANEGASSVINPVIVSVRVNSIQALLVNGSGTTADLLDYAEWLGTAGTQPANLLSPFVVGSGASASIAYLDLEVADARANGRTQDWVWGGGGFTSSGVGADTLGAINNNATPPGFATTTQDPEDGTADPKDGYPGISTCFIKNAPMESLWELGAIHRGEVWRTLNLKEYNHDTTTLSETYENGDANILNQAKLGPFELTRGKFNVNSQGLAWEDILGSVTTGATYALPSSGSLLTSSTTPSISSVTSAITAANGQWGERGAIADSLATVPADGSDAAREELVGKLANLLTARRNYFTVVVTAQSLKDTKAIDPGGSNSGSYDGGTNFCTILAEQKIMATVFRDVKTNTFTVERYEYQE